ncbi:conserved hypothetical protein [Candida dubliniensis CD36]|uniref:Transcription factor domain-containing protein n=1 Tax=Candida dubliniensis (strain CD36 / ATCC MYA-646 / CBS 7987 / NCPF 3949 / NRRL Y-17841) TaxID=573826 RepID=B9WLF3_CANDC|nr:conserved hypothetical protein [Candida dubliniensis CD36]CAX39914.1 conserved hypothetical protein [Candida dubliniensis CD36]
MQNQPSKQSVYPRDRLLGAENSGHSHKKILPNTDYKNEHYVSGPSASTQGFIPNTTQLPFALQYPTILRQPDGVSSSIPAQVQQRHINNSLPVYSPNFNLLHSKQPSPPGPNTTTFQKHKNNSKSSKAKSSETFIPVQTKGNPKPKIHRMKENHTTEKNLESYSLYEIRILFKNKTGLNDVHLARNRIEDARENQLLGYFNCLVGKALDVFASLEIFSQIFIELALLDDTQVILNGIYCLTEYELSKSDFTRCIHYYQTTIAIIHNQSRDNNPSRSLQYRCLMAMMLLCIFESKFPQVESSHLQHYKNMSVELCKNQPSNEIGLDPILDCCFWTVLRTSFLHSSLAGQNSSQFIPDSTFFNLQKDLLGSSTFQVSNVWHYKNVLVNLINIWNFTYDISSTNQKGHKVYDYYQWKIHKIDILTEIPTALRSGIHQQSYNLPFPIFYYHDELIAVINVLHRLALLFLHEGLSQRVSTEDRLKESLLFPLNSPYFVSQEIIGILKPYENSPFISSVGLFAIKHVWKYLQHDSNLTPFLRDMFSDMSLRSKIRI